jgi:hypothetical protein
LRLPWHWLARLLAGGPLGLELERLPWHLPHLPHLLHLLHLLQPWHRWRRLCIRSESGWRCMAS